MGQRGRSWILIAHNRDFPTADDPEFAARADVENAARDVARALAARGWAIETAAAPDDALAAARFAGELAERAPALVFNLCESLAGDSRHEAVLPSLFELCRVPYTGSGPLALGTALRKDRTKAILSAHGVATPAGFVSDGVLPATLPPFPLIVKPTREDASTGIWLRSVVHDAVECQARVDEIVARYGQPALVEQFVDGRELYVSLIGNGAELMALPMHEVDFSAMPAGAPRIVTYDGKWVPTSQEYIGTRSVRAGELAGGLDARCAAAARAAFAALELRDYARVDLRIGTDGTPYVIDVNPNCDLSDGAGVCRAASFAGIAYPELIERIVQAALGRYESERLHVLRDPAAPRVRDEGAGAHAHDSSAVAARPRAAVAAVDEGRAVHARGGLGRARAGRRRAR